MAREGKLQRCGFHVVSATPVSPLVHRSTVDPSYMRQIYERDRTLFPTERNVENNEPTASQNEIDNAIRTNNVSAMPIVDANADDE